MLPSHYGGNRQKVLGRSGDNLLAVVVVDGDGVDGTRAGRELRVELGVLGHLANVHVGGVFARLAALQVGLPRVLVLLEGVPLRHALEHPDAGVPVVLDSHSSSSELLVINCRCLEGWPYLIVSSVQPQSRNLCCFEKIGQSIPSFYLFHEFLYQLRPLLPSSS